MNMEFSPSAYEELIEELFTRFPSFQKVGAGAYKPGIGNMELFDSLAGHPHRQYKIIHVAGTNGKGSVSNMLASVLAASGLKVGLYTSPHIVDFRERMRIVSEGVELVPREYVWDFVSRWRETFDHLDMSFFEITTSVALSWFASEAVDVVVLETGLGGRLDSTNIVTPVMSVITNIGLDHCDMLGETLSEIAFEKAGIIKPRTPVVVGESHPETDAVFERKVLYTNLSEPCYGGDRSAIMSLLTFADKVEPGLWDRSEEILGAMDLQGEYQRKNLRTVLAALEVLIRHSKLDLESPSRQILNQVQDDVVSDLARTISDLARIISALIHTASRTAFRGRWEKISDNPLTICDIGHNEHGLKYNFAQLSKMKAEGRCTDLIIVYGSVADKDVDSVIHLMPSDAHYIFTQAQSRRALPAETIRDKYMSLSAVEGRPTDNIQCAPNVSEALEMACNIASSITAGCPESRPLIYIGGSTYIVSEAVVIWGDSRSSLE